MKEDYTSLAVCLLLTVGMLMLYLHDIKTVVWMNNQKYAMAGMIRYKADDGNTVYFPIYKLEKGDK